VVQSERFFREAWPQISQSVESGTDAASDVQWIAAPSASRPARACWTRKVELFGGLDGTPFSLDAHRLVVVARK